MWTNHKKYYACNLKPTLTKILKSCYFVQYESFKLYSNENSLNAPIKIRLQKNAVTSVLSAIKSLHI